MLHPTDVKEFYSHFPWQAVVLFFWLAFISLIAIVSTIARASSTASARRLFARSEFPSVAKYCGLVTQVGTRKHQIVNGIAREVVGREESYPKLKFGHWLPNKVGVVWTLIPAKGSSIEAIMNASEELAAGMKVQTVRVERVTAYKGKLTVLFGSPLEESFSPDKFS